MNRRQFIKASLWLVVASIIARPRISNGDQVCPEKLCLPFCLPVTRSMEKGHKYYFPFVAKS